MSGRPRRSHGSRALPWRTGLLILGLVLVISQGGEDPIAAAERSAFSAELRTYDPGSLRSALGGAVQAREGIAAGEGEQQAGESPLLPTQDGSGSGSGPGQGPGPAPQALEVNPASFTPATTR